MTLNAMGPSGPDTCEFCIPLTDPAPDRDWFDFHVLDESHGILAVAALGPVAAGHILLVPREHMSSAAQLPQDRYRDLEHEWERWSSRLEETWQQPVLTFEHGSGLAGDESSACITHVHWQLVPTEHATAILSELPAGVSTVRLVDRDRQYLMARVGQETRVLTDGGRPQQIRRRLAAALGRDAYVDYLLFPQLSVMEETIAHLSPATK
jgi:diadenosine tetraphosphate (Ap4A) HIT family hydrolase